MSEPFARRVRLALVVTVDLAITACGRGENLAPVSRPQQVASTDDRLAARAVPVRVDGTPRVSEGTVRGQPPCIDTVEPPPPPQSGGEQFLLGRPCFIAHQGRPTAAQVDETARQHDEARRHREVDPDLLAAESRACAGIGASEREHGPFFHREDIRSVEPLVEDGQVRGARIRFSKVTGLTASWMRRAVGCHLARADAMGFDPTVMPYCPLMIPGVSVEVSSPSEGLLVDVRGRDGEAALAVLGRAEALVEAGR